MTSKIKFALRLLYTFLKNALKGFQDALTLR